MCMNLLDLPISQLKFLNEKLFSTFNTVLESDIHRQQNWLLVSKLRHFFNVLIIKA